MADRDSDCELRKNYEVRCHSIVALANPAAISSVMVIRLWLVMDRSKVRIKPWLKAPTAIDLVMLLLRTELNGGPDLVRLGLCELRDGAIRALGVLTLLGNSVRPGVLRCLPPYPHLQVVFVLVTDASSTSCALVLYGKIYPRRLQECVRAGRDQLAEVDYCVIRSLREHALPSRFRKLY